MKNTATTGKGETEAPSRCWSRGSGPDTAWVVAPAYHEGLPRHEDRHEAMAFALHRATPAILASAATVAIGMLLRKASGQGVAVSFVIVASTVTAILLLGWRGVARFRK